MLLNFKSIKLQMILYLFCFVLFVAVRDRNLALFCPVALAVSAALILNLLLDYLKNKTFQVSESSVITGLIIGLVISGSEPWWKIILAALIAIISKYTIRIKGKHIFNPAAFGLFLMIIFFGVSTQWNGTYLWYILLPFGLYFTHKINKIEVIIGYAVVSLVLFGIQAFWQKVTLKDIFGYFSYFYIFVMVIEPKTSPLKQAGKYLFGALAAGFVFILTQIGVRFDVELCSLLAANCAVPLLNKVSFLKKEVV
ncbi:MAG: RnfABCDGE type electron transport complex subunit D [Candidatus Omnitrophica bacterium]|nr:RnfABCDGE type electron transport complex subunit D [Candidatus Omnitrophota bacterium]